MQGMIYREIGDLPRSLKYFRQAYESVRAEDAMLDSNIDLLRNWTMTNVFTLMGLQCYWSNYERFEIGVHRYAKSVERVTEMTPSMDQYTFSLLRYPSLADDLSNNRKGCSVFDSSVLHSVDTTRQLLGPLRIGYLSYDWRDHPMGRLTRSLVTSHSRSFATSLFSYGYDDNSDIRRYVSSRSDFVDLHHTLSNVEAAQRIAEKNILILVDLTGHTYNNRIGISALKPSPIVINYLGFPGSTGCSSFDYSVGTDCTLLCLVILFCQYLLLGCSSCCILLQSAVVPAELAYAQFSEKLIYLPHSYQSNAMPLKAQPCLRSTDCRRFLYQSARFESELDLSFAPEQTILCSFNSHKKLEPLAWTAWMNVLRRLPRAVLVLLDESAPKQQLLVQARVFGISRSRLFFLQSVRCICVFILP
jgi:predicted O-linked N-acetylglucosamine transferase (SPINDLY family)